MSFIANSTVTIMVSSLSEGVDFYTKTLGFSLIKRYGEHYAEIQAPGLLIGLHPASDKVVAGNNFSIGFAVSDFDAAINRMKSNNINVKVEPDGWSKIAHFSDPDNNALYFIETEEKAKG